jgi:pyridoxine kinase
MRGERVATAAKPSVLVVNSLVTRGSVGGRASVFVLERLGFPVWSVPTIVLPWHPGHGRAPRIAPPPDDFAALVSNLCGAPWLAEVGAVLTGYIGGTDQALPVARLVEAVKAANPAALYLCDPIIGDSRGLYQPEAVAIAIRDHLLPRADIAVPNRHELQWLTGREAGDNAELAAVAGALGPREVVVTSAHAPPGYIGSLVVDDATATLATHRAREAVPHGTGDLFAALYLGHRLNDQSPAEALRDATGATLRLIDLAAELDADEMPLTAGQSAFAEAASGVELTVLSRASG